MLSDHKKSALITKNRKKTIASMLNADSVDMYLPWYHIGRKITIITMKPAFDNTEYPIEATTLNLRTVECC